MQVCRIQIELGIAGVASATTMSAKTVRLTSLPSCGFRIPAGLEFAVRSNEEKAAQREAAAPAAQGCRQVSHAKLGRR
jgi:hypothetical protein